MSDHSDRLPLAVICGNYINAYSIVDSLRALGWRGRIVCLKDRDMGVSLVELLRNPVETWETDFRSPADVITLLQERVPAECAKTIFFTDERFHDAFTAEAASPRLANARFFVGSTTHLDTILDRYEFYRFIGDRKLAATPPTIAGGEDPWAAFPQGFLLRVKRSWNGLERLPRVRPISGRAGFAAAVAELRGRGFAEDQWCYQKVLSISPRHNISVCGWHDRENPIHFATRKVLQHPPKTGNGDVCEIIESPAELAATTSRLLDALEYRGPFELEFVFDAASKTYYVIELNPRLWMQHGLIEAITGHDLVRRYLGVDAPAPRSPDARYWMNTIYTSFRLMRGDLRAVRYFRHSVQVPCWSDAVRWWPQIVPRLARRVVERRHAAR